MFFIHMVGMSKQLAFIGDITDIGNVASQWMNEGEAEDAVEPCAT